MSLTVTKNFDNQANNWVLEIAGEIDLGDSANFKSILIQCIEEKKTDIILDCKKLNFIDSTGLGVIINVYKKLNDDNQKHQIIIKSPVASVKKLLNITGLNKILTIEE